MYDGNNQKPGNHFQYLKGAGPSRSNSPSTSLSYEKPAAMPHPDYSSLTKSEQRQLADPRG
jgi:hypothetical protein